MCQWIHCEKQGEHPLMTVVNWGFSGKICFKIHQWCILRENRKHSSSSSLSEHFNSFLSPFRAPGAKYCAALKAPEFKPPDLEVMDNNAFSTLSSTTLHSCWENVVEHNVKHSSTRENAGTWIQLDLCPEVSCPGACWEASTPVLHHKLNLILIRITFCDKHK